MILSIISFTENGRQLSKRIEKALWKETEAEINIKIQCYTKCSACRNQNEDFSVMYVEDSVTDWAGEQMRAKNALLFIGACGIAVRAVAPFLTDKLQDVPVLVMDETGRYIIPVLSGHMGGANRMAGHIAEKTGAEAVITTATDINKKFAVDLFAKKNGFSIVNKGGIVKVSSKVLAGKEITISIEPKQEIESSLPAGVRLVPYPPAGFADIVVTSEEKTFDASLLLKPKKYVVGMGCRKGKSFSEIDCFLTKKLAALGITAAQIFAIASVSQKADEQGIVEWCQRQGVPFLTYTAEELQETEGIFTESSFVRAQVGVGSVCERAAVRASGKNGKLIAQKEAENGMTIAVAQREWKVCFDGK